MPAPSMSGRCTPKPDVLREGAMLYIVHLSGDPRGFARVHDRARIRQVVEEQLLSHPFLA